MPYVIVQVTQLHSADCPGLVNICAVRNCESCSCLSILHHGACSPMGDVLRSLHSFKARNYISSSITTSPLSSDGQNIFPSWPPVLGIPRMNLFVACCCCCACFFIPPCPPNVPQLPRLGLSSVSSIGGEAGYRVRGLWNVKWRWLPVHFSPPSLVWGRVRVF